jgi:hypothetical protein
MELQTTLLKPIQYGQVKSSVGWVAVGEIKPRVQFFMWLLVHDSVQIKPFPEKSGGQSL